MALNFRYHSIPGTTNGLKKPTIPVEFKLDSGGYITVMCLIDSGSDVIVLPKGIAELLNIKYSGESVSTGLNGEIPVKKGYAIFRIKKEFGYHNLNAPVEVVGNDNIPVLLGRIGFFDKFKVTIDEKRQLVIIKEHPNKL
jgi:predicted aspartyl protease